jgi:type II secretory pathway component PulF
MLMQRGEAHPWLLAAMRLTFNGRRRATFYRFVASYIERKYRLDEALTAIWLEETDEDTKPARSVVAFAVPSFLQRMKLDGLSFAEAFEGWAPAGEIMALRAFERGGLSAETLRYLAHSIRMSDRTAAEIRRIFTRMVYTFLGVQAFAWGMAHYIVPQIFRAIPPRGMSANMVLFKDVFDFIALVGPYLVGVSTLVPVALWWCLPRWVGPWRERVDRWPVFSTYREWQGTVWLRALASLVAAKMTIPGAMQAIRGHGSPYLNYFVDQISDNLSISLPDAMRATGTEWPTPEMITALGIFLRGKDPEQALQVYADQSLEDSQERIGESLSRLRLVGYIVGAIAGVWFYLSVNEILLSFTKM